MNFNKNVDEDLKLYVQQQQKKLGLPLCKESVTLKSRKLRLDLYHILLDLEKKLKDGEIPSLDIRTRTRSNLDYLEESEVWALSDRKHTKKTLKTKGGSKQILKLVKIIGFLITQLQNEKTTTLRDLYYVALNWTEEAQFQKIEQSNTVLQNIEILLNCVREDFNVYPNSEGKIFGDIVIRQKTRGGQYRDIHCSKDVGKSGFLLPRAIHEIEILSVNVENLLVVETDGTYHRCIEQQYDVKGKTAIIVTGGYASRMVKLLISLLHEKYNVKVRVFADGDPHGCSIAGNIISGSIKSSHLSERLCTPKAIHIGLFPSQIERYGLPTYDLTPAELKMLDIMIEDAKYKNIREELLEMRRTKKKAEQQALSYHGFEMITDIFLPNQISKYSHLP